MVRTRRPAPIRASWCAMPRKASAAFSGCTSRGTTIGSSEHRRLSSVGHSSPPAPLSFPCISTTRTHGHGTPPGRGQEFAPLPMTETSSGTPVLPSGTGPGCPAYEGRFGPGPRIDSDPDLGSTRCQLIGPPARSRAQARAVTRRPPGRGAARGGPGHFGARTCARTSRAAHDARGDRRPRAG